MATATTALKSFTATDLRRNLFQTLDLAVQGHPISFTYKGVRIRLMADLQESKLVRAVKRNALNVEPDSIVGPDRELMAVLEEKWKAEDRQL